MPINRKDEQSAVNYNSPKRQQTQENTSNLEDTIRDESSEPPSLDSVQYGANDYCLRSIMPALVIDVENADTALNRYAYDNPLFEEQAFEWQED